MSGLVEPGVGDEVVALVEGLVEGPRRELDLAQHRLRPGDRRLGDGDVEDVELGLGLGDRDRELAQITDGRRREPPALRCGPQPRTRGRGV